MPVCGLRRGLIHILSCFARHIRKRAAENSDSPHDTHSILDAPVMRGQGAWPLVLSRTEHDDDGAARELREGVDFPRSFYAQYPQAAPHDVSYVRHWWLKRNVDLGCSKESIRAAGPLNDPKSMRLGDWIAAPKGC